MVEKFIFANVDDDRYFFVSDDYDLNYCTHTKQQWMVWYVRGYITWESCCGAIHVSTSCIRVICVCLKDNTLACDCLTILKEIYLFFGGEGI